MTILATAIAESFNPVLKTLPIGQGGFNTRSALDDLMAVSTFGGVPVLIVDPDVALGHMDNFSHYMMDRISTHCPALPDAATKLGAVFDQYQEYLYACLEDIQDDGFALPCAMIYPQTGARINAAIILAPDATSTPEQDLFNSRGIQRRGDEPLLTDNIGWRYFQVCHELAHAAGANEPQADYIANLLYAQSFHDRAPVLVNGDIRAIDAMVTATSLATLFMANADHARHVLSLYGWPMVTANDDAQSVPRDLTVRMRQDHILLHCQHSYNMSQHAIFRLGVLARDAGLADGVLSTDMRAIAGAAKKLAQKITGLTADTEIHAMANRFALAARRLDKGAVAYDPAPPGKKEHSFTP